MKDDIIREIELGTGVTAQLQDQVLHLKGPKGEVKREFSHPRVSITVVGNKIVLKVIKGTKREKTIICSFESHIINLVRGVQEIHEYKLKICSGHFPMNVAVAGQEVVIKNFLGESVPRRVTFPTGATVKITGTEILVQSLDKELAGMTAAKIESLCRITNRDRRIFQDGCYIVTKSGRGG